MKRLLSLFLINCSIVLFAQDDVFINYNNLFFEGEGYQIADIKGPGTSWTWSARTLSFSNSRHALDNGTFAECDEWIVMGPFDLSKAQNPKIKALLNVEYGSNAVSIHASKDFSGTIPAGVLSMPGNWTELRASTDITAELGVDTEITGNLSQFAGNKGVYIAFRYYMPGSNDTRTNVIKEISLLREEYNGTEEMTPPVVFSRGNEGVDFFNLSADPSSTVKWSIRRGYAAATSDADIWLISRPFDLTYSADAFFSFASKLKNGNSGPVGIQIKIAKGGYAEGQSINDVEWEDYSKSRVDHRPPTPTDFFESGKLDLSAYCGEKISIAFRYVNAAGEQYEVKDLKMFHLPDTEAPVINLFEIERSIHNKVRFRLNANEIGNVHYGIYNSDDANPSFSDLKNGVGAQHSGLLKYATSQVDSIYVVEGLSSETDYKLVIGIEDGSGNQGVVSDLSFTTPVTDLNAPGFDVSFNSIENHSFKAEVKASESCEYYYLMQERSITPPVKDQLINNGKKVVYDNGSIVLDFYELKKNTEYTLYIYGIDLADNETTINEFTVRTANLDLDSPEFSVFTIDAISNNSINLNVQLGEVSTVFYSVQLQKELAPSVDYIVSGERSVVFGSVEFTDVDKKQEISIDGLSNGENYILYVVAKDASNNFTSIKYQSFTTLNNGFPVITQKNKSRIYIDLESTYDLSLVELNFSGVESLDGYQLKVTNGDNYSVEGTNITTADDYDGLITVPVYLENATGIKSNTIAVDFVVCKERMAEQFKTIREAITGNNLQSVEDKAAAIALLELQANGSFFDKLSPNSPDYSDYMTKVLEGRLKNIAVEYYQEKYRRRKRTEVRHKMYKALEFWMDNRPEWSLEECSARWPEAMGAIVLVLYNDMVEEYEEDDSMKETIERFQSKVLEFNQWCWNSPDGVNPFQPYEGNNMSNRLWGTMALAAFSNSVEQAYEVFDKMLADMEYKLNENDKAPAGWKKDGSYHMNNLSGGQWNWYENGTEWISDVLGYSYLARRSSWRLPKEKFDLLGEVMINGAQWLNWMDFIPYNLLSKHSTRSGRRTNKSDLLYLINRVRYESLVNDYLLADNDALVSLYENLGQEFSVTDSSKYFWNSNIMLHGTSLYNMSLAMPSSRTGAPEVGNDTIYGLTNYFMGDGTCMTFNSEFNYNQRRYLNYKKLPGTTIEQNTYELPLNLEGNNGKSLNDYAGGLTNGKEGLASFYYNKDGIANVNGYKSYFFFKEGMVALGAGIEKKSKNRIFKVLTSVEQDQRMTDVVYHTGGDKVNTISSSIKELNREIELSKPAWIHHNSNGYVVYPQSGGDVLTIGIDEQSGAWDEINGTWRLEVDNPNYIMRYDSAAVVQISIDHKKEPLKAKYAYMVFPMQSEGSFKELMEDNPLNIIQNDELAQVVRHQKDKVTGLAIIQPGIIKVSDELSVEVDKAVTMLLKEKENGEIEAWLNDPYQREEIVNITFMIRKANEKPKNIQRVIVLPNGVDKGQQVYTTTGDIWSLIPELEKKEEDQSDNKDMSEEEESNNPSEDEEANKEQPFAKVFPTKLLHNENLNIQLMTSEKNDVQVSGYTVDGKLMHDETLTSIEGEYNHMINSSELGIGVYIIRIKSGQSVHTQKIIIH
ncbi:MAG: choice-of-anchor J domain-containing protein [Carboxylicivirga sp.]|nr:choice-of-anchor J domain-containing protein [Carboxylicivirga sp.]